MSQLKLQPALMKHHSDEPEHDLLEFYVPESQNPRIFPSRVALA
jgi:hypothetical protein